MNKALQPVDGISAINPGAISTAPPGHEFALRASGAWRDPATTSGIGLKMEKLE
jgi:hypothetical protein